MNNFPTAENIWFVEAHTCFQLFNFVCLAVISLKVSAKFTRNKFKNITASFLLTSYDFILFYFWQYCSSVSSCLLVHGINRINCLPFNPITIIPGKTRPSPFFLKSCAGCQNDQNFSDVLNLLSKKIFIDFWDRRSTLKFWKIRR